MSNVVIFDTQNREIRAVWKTFKAKTARLVEFDDAIELRANLRPGMPLCTVTWADGSVEPVNVPVACSGVVKSVRFRSGPWSELALRPSAVLVELVDPADRTRDIEIPGGGSASGDSPDSGDESDPTAKGGGPGGSGKKGGRKAPHGGKKAPHGGKKASAKKASHDPKKPSAKKKAPAKKKASAKKAD